LGFRQLGQPRYASSPMILVTTSRAARPYTAGSARTPNIRAYWSISCGRVTSMLAVGVSRAATRPAMPRNDAAAVPVELAGRTRFVRRDDVRFQTRGTHREIPARLDVHPQTVRYRIHQLQQLFGDKLTDPDTRLTMELALRAHLLLTPPTPG
jgi:PucR-like helix-turn-helix protein